MIVPREDIFGRAPGLKFSQENNGAQRQPLLDLESNLMGTENYGQDQQSQAPLNYNHRNRMNYHFQKNNEIMSVGLGNFQNNAPYNDGMNTPQGILGGGFGQKRTLEVKQQPINASFDYGSIQKQDNQRQGRIEAPPLDVRTKRQLEREERIQKEKQELQQMQSYNPFGKGGSGAPYKDSQGNIISQRRPFSQVRDQQQTINQNEQLLNSQNAHQSNYQYQVQLNQRFQQESYGQQQPSQYGGSSQIQQNRGITQAYDNDQRTSNQQIQKSPGANQSQKVTRYESQDQLEQRQRKQLQYQEILRVQIEEKKAKEEELKRRKREEDIREERRIKEQIESENEIIKQENLKKQKQQAVIQNHSMEILQSQKPNKRQTRANQDSSRVLENDKSFRQEFQQDQQQFNDFKSKFDQPAQPQQIRSYEEQRAGQDIYQPMSYPSQVQHTQFFSQMENNFQNELQKLKFEMQQQQQEFSHQLVNLRTDAQRNLDQRLKVEQELQRYKLSSEKSQREVTSRRSMIGMNQYEKLFFGGAPSLQNQSQNPLLVGNNHHISQQIGLMNQGLNFGAPQGQDQYPSQGLGGTFEGSQSLVAESTFVPVIFDVPGLPINIQQNIAANSSAYTDPPQIKNNVQPYEIKNKSPIKTNPLYQEPTRPKSRASLNYSQNSQVNKDPSMQYLENQLEEISQLNLGDHYKQTQKQLAEARIYGGVYETSKNMQPASQVKKSQNLPEYNGIQKSPDLEDLLTQFNEVNNALAEKVQLDNEEIKREILQRNVPPLEPIMESSNEQTFPSGPQYFNNSRTNN